MVCSIDTDDFHGVYDGDRFPILKAIKSVLDKDKDSSEDSSKDAVTITFYDYM